MALTAEGLVIKRLSELLAERRQLAVQLFQDLTPPNGVVDTSTSSALGRLIDLSCPSDADLWEAIQQVYSAFDPNSATGIPLDNLVALGGITRFQNTYTTAQMLFTGDNGTLIPAGSVVSSATTGERFNVLGSVALSPSVAAGAVFSVTNVQNNAIYSITYARLTSSSTVSFTSSASSATQASIVAGLKAEIDANHPSLVATIVGSTLKVDLADIFQTVTFSKSNNLGITKVTKLGDVQAEDFGPIEQPVNTITTIATPVLGWDSVTNPISANTGRFKETDAELRERFRVSKFERASNILEALYSALINLDAVEQVVIYENDTDVTDDKGIPAHSFLPIVLGGISTNIAQTIWENKPLGIRSYGNTSVTIYDSQGFPHDIGFERPNPVNVYISIELQTDSNYPQDGDAVMKAAIAAYMEANFGIGDDVVYSRLYTPVNSVPGHQVLDMSIGTSPNPTGKMNIPVNFNELFSLDPNNITITQA
ncbi:MAG: putative baseplate protein J [Prokaryotic dsDNA virus sp.]|nr:MAG: putative baseplate protein J [Prokaryotic dsDNA virus sp.]|tara:strand:+ start:36910 stop:38355 length:1446 start_codon:yes stop_codon:yes gene_type:complete